MQPAALLRDGRLRVLFHVVIVLDGDYGLLQSLLRMGVVVYILNHEDGLLLYVVVSVFHILLFFLFKYGFQLFECLLRGFQSESLVHAVVHELQVLAGDIDAVDEVLVHDQTLAYTDKEILSQLAQGFHKVVQLKRHRHRLSIEEVHVAVVARSLYIGYVFRRNPKQSHRGRDFQSFHKVLTNCTR